jgi:pyruvate dehydrogenase phosphatase
VEVIFFGEGGAANGSVTLNKEASAPAPDAKAKL